MPPLLPHLLPWVPRWAPVPTCPTCRADLPVEFKQIAADRVIDDAWKQLEAERQMIIDACRRREGLPSLQELIEKVDGDHKSCAAVRPSRRAAPWPRP